jgi:hypothetical protein
LPLSSFQGSAAAAPGSAFTNGQIGYDRPFSGAGAYRAHLPSLYLCGSSSHPGGNIAGLPAYNAAQVILADLGITAGWTPPPIAARPAGLCGSSAFPS